MANVPPIGELSEETKMNMVNYFLQIAIEAYSIKTEDYVYFISPAGAGWEVIDIYNKKSGYGFRFTDWTIDENGKVKNYRWFICKIMDIKKKRKGSEKKKEVKDDGH